jgi:hypothetical protein
MGTAPPTVQRALQLIEQAISLQSCTALALHAYLLFEGRFIAQNRELTRQVFVMIEQAGDQHDLLFLG